MQYGLLVGINRYQTPGNDLRGCVHDVASMRVLLGANDFSVLHVRSLIDEQATKDRILSSLDQMVKNMKGGDHGVFHFSGHGSQVPDCNADEADGFDEVLCPHDFDWSSGYLADDEIRWVLDQLDPGATLDVVLDACHSGTGTREVDGNCRCIPYPGKVVSFRSVAPFLRGVELPGNIALWAGCRSDQTSADAFIDGVYQGALTWAFTQVLTWKNFRRDEVIRDIAHNLKDGYDQEPQLECSDSMKERKVFA